MNKMIASIGTSNQCQNILLGSVCRRNVDATSHVICLYCEKRENSTRYIVLKFINKGTVQTWLLTVSNSFPEIEFLDINITKDSSLSLHAINSPFYQRNLKKTILFSGFNNPDKKISETRKSSLFMNSIQQNGKVKVENQTKTRF